MEYMDIAGVRRGRICRNPLTFRGPNTVTLDDDENLIMVDIEKGM